MCSLNYNINVLVRSSDQRPHHYYLLLLFLQHVNELFEQFTVTHVSKNGSFYKGMVTSVNVGKIKSLQPYLSILQWVLFSILDRLSFEMILVLL